MYSDFMIILPLTLDFLPIFSYQQTCTLALPVGPFTLKTGAVSKSHLSFPVFVTLEVGSLKLLS